MSLEVRQVDYWLNGNTYEPTEAIPLRGLEAPHITEAGYVSCLDEINDSFQIIKDPHSGRLFEVAQVNQDKKSETILFTSTMSSSLTTNTGNAIELAAHGAANPNARRVYVAFYGNGGSQSLDRTERKALRQGGRLTTGGGESGGPYRPFDAVVALARALEKYDLVPNHISGDESGGRLGLATMSALDENTVKDVFLNGIPGISHQANYAKAMLSEDARSRFDRRKKAKGLTLDETLPGEIVPNRIKQAEQKLPNIYTGSAFYGRELRTYLPWRYAANLLSYGKAFGGHDDLRVPSEHAALQDTVAAMIRHEAMITLQFNVGSSIHDMTDCIKFGKLAMNRIPLMSRSDERGLRLQIGTGTLDSHTDEPATRWRSEMKALSSIATSLLMMLGGRYLEQGQTREELAEVS